MSSFYGLFLSILVLCHTIQVFAQVTCAPNADCIVNCTFKTCSSRTVSCPSSNTTQRYLCTVNCLDYESCLNTTVTAGSGVSTFSFISQSNNSASYATIISTNTTDVEVMCNAPRSCLYTRIFVRQAKTFNFTVENVIATTLIYSSAFFTIEVNDTKHVSLDCRSVDTCSTFQYRLYSNDFVSINCGAEGACVGGYFFASQSNQVIVHAGRPKVYQVAPSMFANNLNLQDIKNLTIESKDNGMFSGTIWLKNIESVLLLMGESGASIDIDWIAYNITNVAINSWSATSFWIVDGQPVLPQYICKNDSDCNIRVDKALTSTVVVCPMQEISSFNGNSVTCSFYCTASQGCSQVELDAVNTPVLNIYMDTNYNYDITVQANASALSKIHETTATIYCNFKDGASCQYVYVEVFGYSNVTLICKYNSACSWSTFFISNFTNQARVYANDYGLFHGGVVIKNGPDALVTNDEILQSGTGFLSGHISFENINHAKMQCSQYLDCDLVYVNANNVKNLSIECVNDNAMDWKNCEEGLIYFSQSNLELRCLGNSSCRDLTVEYFTNEAQQGSCWIDCQLNPDSTSTPSCLNMTVSVMGNTLGYEAIDLLCETNSEYQACKGVRVECGEYGTTCSCPVTYDAINNSWSCPGMCGTATCYNDTPDSSSSTTDTVVIIVSVVGIVTTIAIAVCCYKAITKKSKKVDPQTPLIH